MNFSDKQRQRRRGKASRNSDAPATEREARETREGKQENNSHRFLEFRTFYVPGISLGTSHTYLSLNTHKSTIISLPQKRKEMKAQRAHSPVGIKLGFQFKFAMTPNLWSLIISWPQKGSSTFARRRGK